MSNTSSQDSDNPRKRFAGKTKFSPSSSKSDPQPGPSKQTKSPLISDEIKDYYKGISDKISGVDVLEFSDILKEGYLFAEILGTGSYGSVYSVKKRTTNTDCAIKVLKTGFGFADPEVAKHEMDIINILSEVKHKNIVEMISMFSNDDLTRSYIVFELSPIGDLFNILQYVNDQNIKVWIPLRENICRYLIRDITKGILFMKQKGVAHGDLKLSNILLFWKSPEDHEADDEPPDVQTLMSFYDEITLKLTDFSNSQTRRENDPPGQIRVKGPLCSINFAAPESYDEQVIAGIRDVSRSVAYDAISADVFSLGANLLAMLLGAHPFDPPLPPLIQNAPDYEEKFQEFCKFCTKMKKDFGFTKHICSQFAPHLREVLLKLLNPKPEFRITVEQFLADKWMTAINQKLKPKALEYEEIYDPKSHFSRNTKNIAIGNYAKDY